MEDISIISLLTELIDDEKKIEVLMLLSQDFTDDKILEKLLQINCGEKEC